MRNRFPALVVTLVALGSLTACGASTVSASDVEDQITTQLKTADGATPDSASCPDDLKAEVGQKITCTATDSEGDTKVEVEVTSVDGSDVGFDITPVG